MQFLKAVLIVLILVFGVTTLTQAASLAEHFQAFILGAEAQARPLERRDLQLDAIAQACLQCHDGSHASHVYVRQAGTAMPIRGTQTLNHPIGMAYDQSALNKPHSYRSRALLHPGIQLVDGQVTCISCHQTKISTASLPTKVAQLDLPRGTNCNATKELTVGRRDKELCLACHIK